MKLYHGIYANVSTPFESFKPKRSPDSSFSSSFDSTPAILPVIQELRKKKENLYLLYLDTSSKYKYSDISNYSMTSHYQIYATTAL